MLIFVSNFSVLSEISIFTRICQTVTCIISGTCQHGPNLVLVNLFNNACFKHKVDKSSQTRLFKGQNSEFEDHILWFAFHAFIFP